MKKDFFFNVSYIAGACAPASEVLDDINVHASVMFPNTLHFGELTAKSYSSGTILLDGKGINYIKCDACSTWITESHKDNPLPGLSHAKYINYNSHEICVCPQCAYNIDSGESPDKMSSSQIFESSMTQFLLYSSYIISVEEYLFLSQYQDEWNLIIDRPISEFFPRYTNISDRLTANWYGFHYIMLDPKYINCVSCTSCGTWLSDRSKKNSLSELWPAIYVDGKIYCRECTDYRTESIGRETK